MMETQKGDRELLQGEVEPPAGLASRTCAKIWETLNSEKQDFAPNSSIFLDSAFFAPESVLPPSFLLQTSEPDEVQREIPKAAKKLETESETEEDEELPPRSSRWIGLIASVSVGMVIAVFLFPMLEFAKRSTRSYVEESWMTEINRRVDQYEQIHSNTLRDEELQPLNLALNGWQELYSEVFSPSLLPPATLWFTMEPPNRLVDTSHFYQEEGIIVGDAPSEAQTLNAAIREQQPFPWANWEGMDDPIPFGTSGLLDTLLLSIPPRSWEGTARSAYGQDVLIKDGRVFFRVLPNREQ